MYWGLTWHYFLYPQLKMLRAEHFCHQNHLQNKILLICSIFTWRCCNSVFNSIPGNQHDSWSILKSIRKKLVLRVNNNIAMGFKAGSLICMLQSSSCLLFQWDWPSLSFFKLPSEGSKFGIWKTYEWQP